MCKLFTHDGRPTTHDGRRTKVDRNRSPEVFKWPKNKKQKIRNETNHIALCYYGNTHYKIHGTRHTKVAASHCNVNTNTNS